jgi:hypothetical protein
MRRGRFDAPNPAVQRGRRRAIARGLVAQLLCIWLVASCSSRPPRQVDPAPFSGNLRPHPKPGESITNSELCACRACGRAACCQGPSDDAEGGCTGTDFSAPGCGGIAIESCVGRCYEEKWRVKRGESCDSKRPRICCAA